MFLLVPFSCLTGATPFTGDEPLLPLTKGCCCGGGGDEDADSSSNGAFDATDETSLMLLSGCDDGGLLLLTNAVFCGDAGDEGGDFATSSSTLHTRFSFHTKS